MRVGLSLLLPTGILLAWAAPWTCATYATPDGGSNVNPWPDSGTGGRRVVDSGVTTVYDPDSGNLGIMAGPDGGVTVGASALFSSDFVYASNYADGTVSRVVIPPDAGLVPYEQARYVGVVPENNHGTRVFTPWQASGCGDQLYTNASGNQGPGGYGGTSPSRTVVDRKGNVAVALRASCGQAGITRIINVGDHLSDCHIRCPNRTGLAPNQRFTEGTPLTTSSGSTIELLPSPLPGGMSITGAVVLPDHVIAAGTSAATTYSCPGHSPTDQTDPVNYDDCLDFSVALGSPNPDTQADPGHLTNGISYGRAAAISPHCAPASGECDAWLGMWTGAAWIHLANGATPPLKLYDVQAVDHVGDNLYGGTVDCAGILWGAHGACAHPGLTAVTTVPLLDLDAGIAIPADTVITNWPGGLFGVNRIPDFSQCAGYGVSSDTAERIWVAGGCGGNSHACSFNAGALLKAYPYIIDAGAAAGPTLLPVMQAAWQSYNFGAVGLGGGGRGINVDKDNNVFQGMDSQGAAVGSFNPDPDGGAYSAIPCVNGAGGTCRDRWGTPTPLGGVLKWTHSIPGNGDGNNTIGVDLDAEGQVWAGQAGADTAGHATAVRFNGQTGAFMSSVEVGSGLYSYSDFTGYALREITLSSSTFEQSLPACGGQSTSPDFTAWTGLDFQIGLAPGTDARFDVSVTNATDAATLAAATTYPVCASIASGTCTTLDAQGNGALDLSHLGLPEGAFLNVYVTLVPRICAIGGGGSAQAKPVLYHLGATDICIGA